MPRLIDANDALERLKKAEQEMKVVSTLGCKAVPMYGVIDFIASRPTVDAVEVVHGRWLKLSPWNNHTQSCLCLNCDSISYQKKSGVYIGKIPNYCPNCGAKMDGDADG